MNQRIRELIKQANPSGDFSDCEWVFEKFAELIVRECAAYAFSDDQDHKAMLKHFGVDQ